MLISVIVLLFKICRTHCLHKDSPKLELYHNQLGCIVSYNITSRLLQCLLKVFILLPMFHLLLHYRGYERAIITFQRHWTCNSSQIIRTSDSSAKLARVFWGWFRFSRFTCITNLYQFQPVAPSPLSWTYENWKYIAGIAQLAWSSLSHMKLF